MVSIEETYPNQFNILEDEIIVIGNLVLTPDVDDVIEVNGKYKDNTIYFLMDAENDFFMIDENKYVIIYDMDAFTKAVLNKIKEAI